MGSVISTAADGIGGLLGNIFAIPFKTIFGGSCEDVCSGPWDLMCFIEHLCVASLAKLLMISSLCFIVLMFFYLWFKLGICQCVVKSLCKMCCAACEAYWCALGDMLCFVFHKLKNTKRVNRRRRRRFHDIEGGFDSNSQSEFLNGDSSLTSKKRKSVREDINIHRRMSLDNLGTRGNRSRRHHHRRHVRLKTRDVSIRLKGGSQRLRRSRRQPRRSDNVLKKRRLRRS